MSDIETPEAAASNAFTLDTLLGVMPKKIFELPLTQEDNDYFPDFLKSKIDTFKTCFRKTIKPYIKKTNLFEDELIRKVQDEIDALSSGILKTVKHFYEGDIYEASKTFYDVLDGISFVNRSGLLTLNKGEQFYRTRLSSSSGLAKKDLFHNPFQNRHLVKTSRYSIPGFPALYVGDSIYVCWEEYSRPPIRNVFFSRLSSTKGLAVIRIQPAS